MTSSQHLSYPSGFGGDPALLEALASFFNTQFHPSIPVQPSHIITVSGAGNALDSLLCSICDDGDSVLVPVPYWGKFGWIHLFGIIGPFRFWNLTD